MRRRRSKNLRSLALMAFGALLLVLVVGLALRPTAVPNLRENAHRAQNKGDLTQALTLYTRALEEMDAELRGRERVQARAALLAERGQCNLELGRDENALRDLRESRALLPGEAVRWIREGEAYLQFRRFAEAARLYEEAALAFPDRDRFFRYASGAANYSQSRVLLNEAVAALGTTLAGFLVEDLRDAAWSFVAGARTLQDFLDEYLPGPQDTPARTKALGLLRQARKVFVKADEQFADYDSWSRIEPASALVRARMDYGAGRLYRMKRLVRLVLSMRPPIDVELELKELLANSEYELGNYQEAAQTFLSMRPLYLQKRDINAGRRATHFAVECYLRAGDGEASLSLLEAGPILANDNPTNLYILGRARFLAGREDYINPIVRAVDILRVGRFSAGSWSRLRRNRDRILFEMIECLRAGERNSKALEVATVGTVLYPDMPEFHRLRLEILKEMGGRPGVEAEIAYQVLQLGTRRMSEFDAWLAAEQATWPSESALAKEVANQTRRVLQEFARPGRFGAEPAEDRTLADLLGQTDDRGRNRTPLSPAERAEQTVRRHKGNTLLGELRGRPFLAYQVHLQLVRESQRDCAYLLLQGLADNADKVPHFRFLLAEYDMIDGRLAQANESLQRVLDQDPQDVESALSLWRNYQQMGLSDRARELETAMLKRDPDGAGRLLACLSALHNGFPETAIRIGEGTDPASFVYGAVTGLVAQAKFTEGRVREALVLANQALKVQPGNPFATVALLLVIDSQPAAEDGTVAQDHIRRHSEALLRLPIGELADLGNNLYRNGAFDLAQQILLMVLERNANHVPARRDLVDCLIGEGQLDEAENQLNRLDQLAATPDIMRRGLLTYLREGADKAYLYLRSQTVPAKDYARHRIWISLLGAEAGRLPSAIRNLLSEDNLPPDVARYLAMEWRLSDLKLPPDVVPPAVLAMYKSLVDPQNSPVPRDRELERWISLEMASEAPRFSRMLLPALMLRDHVPFEPLRRKYDNALLTRFPSLGPLARAEAKRAHQGLRTDRAVRILLDQVSEDPADQESLELLALWSGELNLEQVDRLLERVQAGRQEQGITRLLEGLRESVNDPARGLELLAEAAASMSVPGPALVASLRIQERDRAAHEARPTNRSPYSILGDRNRARKSTDQFEHFLGRLLAANPEDRSLQAYLVDSLDRLPDPSAASQTLVLHLMDRLLLQPSDNWKAYRIMADILVRQSPDRVPIERLGVALRTSLGQFPETPRTLDTARALGLIARGLREHGMFESASALLEVAERICPYDASLIEERARLVEGEGKPIEAIQIRKMAIVCGSTDPELTNRMAGWALDVDFDLDRADLLATRSLDLLAAHPSPELESEALRIRGKVAYIRGDYSDSMRMLRLSSRVLGEDELRNIDLALEAISTGANKVARDSLMLLARTEGPYQELLRRLGSMLKSQQSSATTSH